MLDIFFPKYCLECRTKGRYLCDNCVAKSSRADFKCPQCSFFSYGGHIHSACISKNTLSRGLSIWKYDGVIRKSILALKYKFASSIADELATLAASELVNFKFPEDKYLLIPVPLHRKRLNWRGFNQSLELGERISRTLGWECAGNALIKLQDTTPQAQLGRQERLQNISGKYAINPQFRPPKDFKTIIFDDVWTTGATIKEAAKVLKQNGANQVWGLTIARS